MKALLIICMGLLFIAIFKLPIGYYSFLRIVVTIGSVAVVVTEFNKELNIWVISFGILAILFNPIIPIYFNNRSVWAPIDLIGGVLFLIKSIKQK